MICPVCFNDCFSYKTVLQERLINEWNLNKDEVDYINKQQGYFCTNCLCNLRSMTLADGIMKYYSYKGTFQEFSASSFGRTLEILEINEAGGLHSILSNFKKYTYAEYPNIDIQKLPYKENIFDLVVHSDTLEHVENSQLALGECYRVLKDGGVLFYTIPIIYGRMTRRRDKLSASYHGSQDESQGEDYKVYTEYGADFWVELLFSNFSSVKISTYTDISSIAICASKVKIRDNKLNPASRYSGLFKKLKRKIKLNLKKFIWN